MGELAVDVAGLHGLASRCRAWSEDIAEPAMPAMSVPGFSTGAAITEVQSGLDAVSETLADRMRQFAAALQDATHSYRATEAESAKALRHLAEAS